MPTRQTLTTTARDLAADVNAAHERLLLMLATIIDDAIFDVVISSEQAVHESQIQITGLINDGV